VGMSFKNLNRLQNLKGPAFIIANHNSHLDTLVLMSLFPLKKLVSVRPVAAAFYWQKNIFISLFAKYCMDIIPLKQNVKDFNGSFHEEIKKSLDKEKIIIFFPEGSRGEAEKMGKFKKGIYYLAQEFNEVPILPVFLYGLGKTLPRGEFLPVPFVCNGNVGEKIIFKYLDKEKQEMNTFLEYLEQEVIKLK
jgi:1-acyl-sn-glycerol-3-phosphate acyltransferase